MLHSTLLEDLAGISDWKSFAWGYGTFKPAIEAQITRRNVENHMVNMFTQQV